MLRAIAEDANPDRRKVAIQSSRLISYIPNTFLVIALSKLDRCGEVPQYISRARNAGIAAAREENYFAEAVTAADDCNRKLITAAEAAATSALQRAQQAKEQVDRLAASAEGRQVLADQAALASRRSEVNQSVTAAQTTFQNASTSGQVDLFASAGEFAVRAAGLAEALGKDLQAAINTAKTSVPEITAAQISQLRTRIQTLEGEEDRIDGLKRDAAVRSKWSNEVKLGGAESQADKELETVRTTFSQLERDKRKVDYDRITGLLPGIESKYKDVQRRFDELKRAPPPVGPTPTDNTAELASEADSAINAAQSQKDRLEGYRANTKLDWSGTATLGPAEAKADASLSGARTDLRTGRSQKSESRLQRARTKADAATSAYREIAQAAQTLLSSLIPETVTAAARQYLKGDYAALISLVESSSEDDQKILATLRLFEAAARYAVAAQDGAMDDLGEVRAAIQASRTADPELAPSEAFFSPPFLELFRAEAGAGSN